MRNPQQRMTERLGWLGLAALWAWPATAAAHEESGVAGGLLGGLHHPVSGLDHVVAMIAVGLWGAQLGKPGVWVLPVTFPLMMAVGGFLGLIGVPLPGVEIGIALSAVALGAVVVCEAEWPLWAAMPLVGVFAIFHGYAHGAELPTGSNAVFYSIGFVVATGLLHGVGISIGLLHSLKRGAAIVRLAGGAIGLAGLYFLWSALA